MRRRDGAVLGLALVALVAGALATLDRGTRRRASAFGPGSVFDESPEGLSLALRYLRERARLIPAGQPVGPLTHRIGSRDLPADAVVFRIRPRRLPFTVSAEDASDESRSRGRRAASQALLTPAEEAWVRGGGRLVLGLDGDYGPITVSAGSRAEPVRKVFPAWPELQRLVGEGPPAKLGGPPVDAGQTLFASGAAPALVRLAPGRGEVFLLALPAALENGRLRQGDHLRLLEAMAGSGRPVFFDEWAHGHGEDPGLLALLLGWGFGPSFAFGALAFALLVWRGRTRVGAPEAAPPETRSEAVDLVESLAQLYGRALTRRDAIALHVEGLRSTAALRTGSRGEALERRLRELLGGTLADSGGTTELTKAQFQRGLHAVNEGYRRLGEHADTRHRP
jgi:hypothetical protein